MGSVQHIGPARHWIAFENIGENIDFGDDPGVWTYLMIAHVTDVSGQKFVTTTMVGETAVQSPSVIEETWLELDRELEDAVRRAAGAS